MLKRLLEAATILTLSFILLEASLFILGWGDPLKYVEDKKSGYKLVPNQQRQMLGPTININSLGLRGAEQIKDRKKIMFFGDSVTNGGARLRDDETFVELINQRLVNSGFQALNAGINNYGPQNVYGLFTLLRKRIAFDSAVLVIPSIDFRRGFKQAPSQVDIQETFICRTHYFFRIFYLIGTNYFKNLVATNSGKTDEKRTDIVNLNISAYKKIIESVQNGIIIFIPSRPEIIAQKKDEDKKRFIEELSAISTSVVIIDLYPVLFKYSTSIFRDDVHFNALGHELLAKIIWPAVEELVDSAEDAERSGA